MDSFGKFLVFHEDVFHSGLCGDVGNIIVHDGVFDRVAIETTNKLTYPDSMSLETYKKEHNTTHNKKGKPIEYRDAIDFLGEDTSKRFGKMVSSIKNSFASLNRFYDHLHVGHKHKKTISSFFVLITILVRRHCILVLKMS